MQIEHAVSEEFNRVMNAVGVGRNEQKLDGSEAETGYRLTTGDCQRLISIEQALQEQKQLLLGIAAKQVNYYYYYYY